MTVWLHSLTMARAAFATCAPTQQPCSSAYVPNRQPSRTVTPTRGLGSLLIQRRCACGGIVGPGGECEACRSKRLAGERASMPIAERPFLPAEVGEALQSAGRPLDESVRLDMEHRFTTCIGDIPIHASPTSSHPTLAVSGSQLHEHEAERWADLMSSSELGGHNLTAGKQLVDFSSVRIHTDPQGAASAPAIGAAAYTAGEHVVFAPTTYSPLTAGGRRLIAHELSHVLQQRRGAASGQIQTFPWVAVGAGVAAGAGYLYSAYQCLDPLRESMNIETNKFRSKLLLDTGRPVHNRSWDSFGHCWIGCAGTKKCGRTATLIMGQGRELLRELGWKGGHDSYRQDTNNEAHGRDFGGRGDDCSVACDNAVRSGALDLSEPEATCYDGSSEFPAPCEPGGPGPGAPAPPGSPGVKPPPVPSTSPSAGTGSGPPGAGVPAGTP